MTAGDRIAISVVNSRLPHCFEVSDVEQGARLKARQYVGLFELPSVVLEVVPKSGIGPRNLAVMLARTAGLKRSDLPSTPLDSTPSTLQDELARLFLDTLRFEVDRGLARRHQERDETLTGLRGKLRVTAYLRRSRPLDLPVRIVEASADHLLNRVLLYTLGLLARRLRDRTDLQRVALLRSRLVDAGVTVIRTLPPKWERLALDRLQRRYQAAFGLARLLLEGMGVILKRGRHDVRAFSFDMDRLFEQFMTVVLVEDVVQGRFEVDRQGAQLLVPHLFTGDEVRLKPDLLVWMDNGRPLVIDFKNKVLDAAPDSGDLRQMYVYARHLGGARAALFYPGGAVVRAWTASQGDALQVCARGVRLDLDLRNEYPAFVAHLREHLIEEGLTL